ncbi:MAG: spermidine/putrescine ABC transporter ATP-binding protein [Rhodobacteraceae bacterium CG17_big_fil_post_rev_8_21_14_2_50_63_15]|nr:MAG: spermidine/putrescine ABC transporter ATP-binding protein [Rhodobacteraceae bacterium CG17_big_fil_post_rev_8_21_14_2_50_63_15]
MAFLDLTNLEKIYGANRVVKDFNLGVDKGEFISLLGPSGCGKTTVLRMVAGFETPTSGTISIDGQDVTGQRPNQRAIGMMFQAYALFPNMTVADNVAFGLKVKGVPRAEREARVVEMLRLISLPDLATRFPFQLSGGQQQRVALARALAPQPRVLLLDEPLSALDAKVRVSLRNEIREIQRELGITTIFVTHDQEEAMSISDRIVVMNGGMAEQAGAPFEIYNNPRTRFVAGFVGTLNMFKATVETPEAGMLSIAGHSLTLPKGKVTARKGDTVTLALRPEAIRLGRVEGREIVLPATIDEVHFLGSVIRVRAQVAGAVVALDTFNRPDQPPPPVGSSAEISFAARDVILLEDE